MDAPKMRRSARRSTGSFTSVKRKSSLVGLKPRDNIKVAVRCRPLLPTDARRRTNIKCGRDSIEVGKVDGELDKVKTYSFDYVYPPHTSQKHLFERSISPMIDSMLQGFNCTVFAYGQTGTGKTYTMEGRQESHGGPSAGIITRSVNSIFRRLGSDDYEPTITVSHLEIYNEELCDLLNENDEQVKLTIYSDEKRVYVKDLTETVVQNADDIFNILDKSLKKRRKGMTELNKESSRSHCIFTITVRMKEPGTTFLKTGTLNLVDLAGSECIGKVSGLNIERARETKNINMSLLMLGMVISSLVSGKSHIPYRSSKLTRLLQQSLGGNNQTLLFATVAPSSAVDVVLNTLSYARKAKKIQNKPEINVLKTEKKIVKNLLLTIEKLKKELGTQRSKNGVFLSQDEYDRIFVKLQTSKSEISNLATEKGDMENQMASLREEYGELELECRKVRKQNEQLKTQHEALRKKNAEILQKAKRLEGNNSAYRDLLDKSVSERDILFAKTESLEMLQKVNLQSSAQNQKALQREHATLKKNARDFFEQEKRKITSISESLKQGVSSLETNFHSEDVGMRAREEGMLRRAGAIRSETATGMQKQIENMQAVQRMTQKHHNQLQALQAKVSRDMQDRSVKLAELRAIAEAFVSKTRALEGLFQATAVESAGFSTLSGGLHSGVEMWSKEQSKRLQEQFFKSDKVFETLKDDSTERKERSEQCYRDNLDKLRNLDQASNKLQSLKTNLQQYMERQEANLGNLAEIAANSSMQQYERTHDTPRKEIVTYPVGLSPLPDFMRSTESDSHRSSKRKSGDEFIRPAKRKCSLLSCTSDDSNPLSL